jgi:hypothetical protein
MFQPTKMNREQQPEEQKDTEDSLVQPAEKQSVQADHEKKDKKVDEVGGNKVCKLLTKKPLPFTYFIFD